MKPSVLQIFLIASVSVNFVTSLNILGVFPYEGKSHSFVYKPFLVELADRGHNLTVISHFPQVNPRDNYHDISLAGKTKVLESVFPMKRSYWAMIQITLSLIRFGTKNCKLMLEDENVQQLWKSDRKFDVVLMEQFNSDCALGLAHVLGAPVVALTTTTLMVWHYRRFGIQYHPSCMHFMVLEGGTKPTIYQRITRTIFKAGYDFFYKYFDQRVDQTTLAQYFDDVPPLELLSKNIKVLLLYQSPALTGSMYLPANVKEVGGYHIAKTKKLPADLKKYIEEAEHGTIYISFGSMLKANSLPKDKLDAIVGAISELPQRIIWKWEEDTLPGQPKNVYLAKWLPQNDILAHPNVIAFYSHCGLLGTTEALHHGVPMVGMPVFGDQAGNAAMMEESGLGVQISVAELNKDLLLEKFETILNPEFRAQVKQLSNAFHDRPMSAMDTAVFWTEFAARQRNITFKNASLTVPYYQYLGLDVIGILLAVFLSFCYIFIIFIRIIRFIYSKSVLSKTNVNKKRQ